MPRRLADNPSALSFRSDNGRVLYSEDVYVGYRWYDALNITPLFPFGHGLSYTTFKLADLHLAHKTHLIANGSINGYVDGNDDGEADHPTKVDPNICSRIAVRLSVRNTGS